MTPSAMKVRFERRWRSGHLPVRHLLKSATDKHGFDFTAAMTELSKDIASCTPNFQHIDMSKVMVTATINRKRSTYGLQARLTPMRFKEGSLTTRRRGTLYGLQRYFVGECEMLYLLTFVLPRFLNQSFEEKLSTVFHELFHMSTSFDGDLRRFGGRYSFHSRSKKNYDRTMEHLASDYARNHRHPGIFEFLNWNFDEFQHSHGGVRAVVIPCPRLVPISVT